MKSFRQPKSMLRRIVDSLTNSGASTPREDIITKDNLFEKVPDSCNFECDSCTIKYPLGFKIDEDSDLWQSVKGWSSHIIVATGKSDWVRDVADEKGSIMEALDSGKLGTKPTNGKLMISASNMCPPPEYKTDPEMPTTVLLLPSFTIVEMVKPKDVPELVEKFINPGPTTTKTSAKKESKLKKHGLATETELADGVSRILLEDTQEKSGKEGNDNDTADPEPPSSNGTSQGAQQSQNGDNHLAASISDFEQTNGGEPLTSATENEAANGRLPSSQINSYLKHRPCPHDYLILLCSHKRRDARCGQSAPLLQRELARHLRPLGLYRDLDDERPGGVGIYFINHVGGHKYSANMIIYRKKAGQGIWLARIKPQDIEGIVKWTLLEGKVKPELIRGGFDRERGVASW